MKRKLSLLIVSVLLIISSCTETFEPSIDYGDQTFINDYSGLIEAVNNLNKSISERIDALNKLVASGLADVKVSINENTKSINLLTNGVSTLNTTIFNGFEAIEERMLDNNTKLITAINKNTELLALQIDKTGKLIQTQLYTSLNELKEAIEDNTKRIEEKLGLIDGTLSSGFASVRISINDLEKTLKLKLEDINTTLFDGFKVVGDSISVSGNRIVVAIDENGNKIVAEIDAKGKLIRVGLDKIKGEISSLILALNDASTSLNAKIDTLNMAITNGLDSVKISVNDLTKQVYLSVYSLETNMLDGFKMVSDSTTANGNRIVTAINDKGDKVVAEIKSNGEIVKLGLDEIKTRLNALILALNNANTSLNDKIDALNTAITTKMGDIIFSINELTKQVYLSVNSLETKMLDGFKMVSDSTTANGNRIVTAINDNGDAIVAEIKSNGEIVKLGLDEIKTRLNALILALNNANTSLNDKIDALNTAITTKMGDIIFSINELTKQVYLSVLDLKTGMLDGFKMVSDSIAANGNRIVTAINDNGDAIVAEIDKNTNALIFIATAKGEIPTVALMVTYLNNTTKPLKDRFLKLNSYIKAGLLQAKLVDFVGTADPATTPETAKILVNNTEEVNALLTDGSFKFSTDDATGKSFEFQYTIDGTKTLDVFLRTDENKVITGVDVTVY